MIGLVGCTTSRPSITVVQFQLGTPDAISDRSGDLERYYSPYSRPIEEWPANAPRTFYYLKEDLMITFVGGREVSRSRIPTETRRGTLQRIAEMNWQNSPTGIPK